jgi:hypothetical protein
VTAPAYGTCLFAEPLTQPEHIDNDYEQLWFTDHKQNKKGYVFATYPAKQITNGMHKAGEGSTNTGNTSLIPSQI